MKAKQFLRAAMLCALVCSGLTSAPPSGSRQDRAWKRYHNTNVGYCVNYPSRWLREEAFDGTGMVMETGIKKYSKPIGEIDIGLLPLPTMEDARMAPATSDSLLDDLKDHIAGLHKFVRAERLQTIDQHAMEMQGHSALFVKNRYYDPLERADWTEEVIFVKRQGELFRLELQCQSDQVARFEPVFTYVAQTMQFDCK